VKYEGSLGTILKIDHRYVDCDRTETTATVRWDKTGGICEYRTDDDSQSLHDFEDVTPRQYLNVYLHDRAYGGPEEGGWWYDTYEPVRDNGTLSCRLTHPDPVDAEIALKIARALCDEENETRTPPSSVCSEGHFIAVLEAWPAEPQPSRRPHYC
jgi:hypothetical protein